MTTVHVSNIAPETNETTLKEFFSFCGEIDSTKLEPVEGKPGTASITFKRENAASNACLIDGTELNGLPLKVEQAKSLGQLAGSHQTAADTDEHIRQEDKPRTAVLAEYLAAGYQVGEAALQKGIDLDKQHGISQRFTQYLHSFDSKLKATDTARSVDTSYGVTDKAKQGYNVIQQYFEKALDTPTGQKIRAFYTEGQKQVLDIHNEAVRLKELKQQEKGASKCGCTGTGNCSCAPGQCNCENCKSGHGSSGATAGGSGAFEGEKQKCNCSSEAGCTCEPGKCACANCGK